MKLRRWRPSRSAQAFILSLALALPGRGEAQEAPGTGEKAAAGAKTPVADQEIPKAANIERWRTLSPEKKEKLREIYRRLETLPPAKRQALLDRLRRMDSQERKQAIDAARIKSGAQEAKAQKKAPGKVAPRGRKAASGPEAEGKTAALRKRDMETRLGKTVDRWTDQLPPRVRDRVKLFTRREQIDLFRSYRETEVLMRALPERSERDRLLALPPDRLRALARPDAARPEGISQASWDRWVGLRPAERLIVLRRLEKLRSDVPDRPAPQSGSAAPSTNAPAPGPAPQK